MIDLIAAGTYVQLTREEFEDWLGEIGYPRSKWQLKDGKGGVYWLFLSDSVAVEINSTTGHRSEVMERGRASMKCKLVSRVTGQTLNKKAMGQSHFKRTMNWRQTWEKGIDNLKSAYVKSKDWYDTIASIKDRDAYKQGMLDLIESKTNWQNDRFLSDLHGKVEKGGILTQRQIDAINRKGDSGTPDETAPGAPAPAPSGGGGTGGADFLTRIEAIPGWEDHEFLMSLHDWVERRGYLTEKQEAALERFEENARRRQEPQGPTVEDILTDLRAVYMAAKRTGNQADMNLAAEMGKRIKQDKRWSGHDGQQVNRLMSKYRVRSVYRRASITSLVERWLSA